MFACKYGFESDLNQIIWHIGAKVFYKPKISILSSISPLSPTHLCLPPLCAVSVAACVLNVSAYRHARRHAPAPKHATATGSRKQAAAFSANAAS